jgi:hypothetical protein
MMSYETMGTTFTERQDDGDFTIEIVAYVANSHVSISFTSPEHEAQFNFDNRLGLSVAEARLHPALIAEFIEKAIGDGEVKYYFERRSDALAKEPNHNSSRGSGGQR